VVGSAAVGLEKKVVGWAEKLDGIATGGGSSGAVTHMADAALDEVGEGGDAKRKAGVEGLRAGLHGKSPVWAAIKGAWEAGTPVVRAAMIAGGVSAVLLLVLSPVSLLVFLLALLVLEAVQRARQGTQARKKRRS
jgi:hypothetical protein